MAVDCGDAYALVLPLRSRKGASIFVIASEAKQSSREQAILVASLALAMTSILATHSRPRLAPQRQEKFASGRERGRRSAERRIQPIPRSTDKRCHLPMPGRGGAPCRQVYAVCALICLRGALAFRRYTAALAGTFTSWLSSRPCLLGSVRAGILPALSGSQSSGSTPRLGRSTEGNDAQSRSGAGCETARKHRTRSTLQIASGMRPSMSEIRWLYLIQ